ncbi:hypothetical protein T4D_8523 [Trichinella pseudospiralis]|uniref:Uncharacterized protein n=1 Tax=Trichinella pseudospiralis TaxID=6337 RepID=A0A0V1FKN7_TRIPS|nr:hypothetical protein T4D_8523 [Trichinella pseudospiralis]
MLANSECTRRQKFVVDVESWKEEPAFAFQNRIRERRSSVNNAGRTWYEQNTLLQKRKGNDTDLFGRHRMTVTCPSALWHCRILAEYEWAGKKELWDCNLEGLGDDSELATSNGKFR